MTSDPVRLLEDPTAGAVLRSDLVHAAEAELHGLDLAAGLAALQKATATVTSSTTVVAGTSLLAKLGIGAAGVAVGAVALWLGLGGGGSGAGDGERVSPPAVASAAEREVEEPREPAGARGKGTETPVRAKVEVAPSEPVAPMAGEPMAIEPGEALEPELGEAAIGEPGAAKPTVRRKGAPADRPSGVSEKPDAADARPAAEPTMDGVLREAKLVAKARSNLARDPSRALALAEEAERDFPQGQLVEERRAIAIRALVALGRVDEAQRRAEPFLAEYGRGAHAAAVRRALEDQADSP